jgi:hypothetical protein
MITYKNYTAKPSGNKFNLFITEEKECLKDTKDKKRGESYPVKRNLGYGLNFDQMIEKIAQNEILSKQDVISLPDYIISFRNSIDEIKKMLYG